MKRSQSDFRLSVLTWLESESSVQSAVLFGSNAFKKRNAVASDNWADLDLHIVATAPKQLLHVAWARVMPSQKFALQVVRPATGGVQKLTVLFVGGQIELVLVPARVMESVRAAMSRGLHLRAGPLRDALNEMATCLCSGYRFLKGKGKWGEFYAKVADKMAGVRLRNVTARALADVFLCDLLWVLQKLERGELVAAQHLLHRSLSEINLRLMRELWLRRGLVLPSFGLGRRVETLLQPSELKQVQIDARLKREDLREAAWGAFDALSNLMSELVPAWQVPKPVNQLLASFPRAQSL